MDDRSFRLGNRILGNAGGCAGPRVHRGRADAALRRRRPRSASPAPRWTSTLRRHARCRAWTPVVVPGGRHARVRRPHRSRAAHLPARRAAAFDLGTRARLARRRSPSAASAGTAGASCAPATCCTSAPTTRRSTTRSPSPVDPALVPTLTTEWELAVVDGPHAAPDFVTEAGIARVLRHRLAGPSPLVAHRRAPGRAAGRVGARRRRRSRTAPVERARHALHRRRGRLHRRHADRARARRSEPRRVHVPGDRDRRRPVEARPAGAR